MKPETISLNLPSSPRDIWLSLFIKVQNCIYQQIIYNLSVEKVENFRFKNMYVLLAWLDFCNMKIC